MENSLNNFLEHFFKVSKKPHEFLSVQENLSEDIKVLIKEIYDYTKHNEEIRGKSALPKLIINKFDDEQIWQELELQNSNFADETVEKVSQLSVKKDKLKFPLLLKCNKTKEANQNNSLNLDNKEEDTGIDDFVIEDVESGSADENNSFDEGDEEEEENGSDRDDDDFLDKQPENIQKTGKLKPSVVDDKFFKLAELELFLQNEEKNENKPVKERETIDLFEKVDDGPAEYKYADFFENPLGETKSQDNEQEDFESAGYSEGNRSENDEDVDENSKRVESKDDENMESEDEEISDLDEEQTKEDGKEEEKDESRKKVRFSLLGSDDESSDGTEDEAAENNAKKVKATKKSDKALGLSSLEERQSRLGKMIEKLENEALSEKPWQLKGEVTANARPQNSLLEEAVDFDLSVRPAPLMTEEVTMKLEDIILQRIKDKAWDDVERKVKPVETPSEFKKKLALDQEKSKLSLAEVYEKEFIKQRDAATADDGEKQETEPALHVEVRSMLSSLFNKLDALSSYHYTPRPVAPEMKVVTNVPAINMEEVAPITVADSTLLAPEEIKGKKRKGELMSKEERTETDKKRARRLKKTRQRQRQRDKMRATKEVTKINPGLGNKYTKEKAVKQLLDSSSNITKMDENKEKSVKSSTAFFNKLQDEVKSQIKSKSSPFTKKKDKFNITAKKLKL